MRQPTPPKGPFDKFWRLVLQASEITVALRYASPWHR